MSARLIALRLPPESFPAALRSVWDEGDVALPLPLEAPVAAIDHLLRTFRPDRIIAAADHGEAADPGDPHREVALTHDTALVVPTSGSTGPPKGVMLSHAALRASTQASLERLGAADGQRFTLALPLHHVAGIQIVLRSWACGTQPEILPRPDPNAVAAAVGDHISLVPTQLHRLLEAGVDLRRWHTILLGGARADPDLLHRSSAAGLHVVTSYGMTETGGGCVYDGRPLRRVEVARREDGRLKLRGPMLFSGYLGDPGATSAALDRDGWFVTGDLGRVRRDRVEIIGRADDIIVSGGENVPAGRVADALRTHPGVRDVAVIGLPDPDWGEVVVAVIVPRRTHVPPELPDLRRHLEAVLPSAYAPRRLVITRELPRDAMGKVTVAGLRTRLRADSEGAAT